MDDANGIRPSDQSARHSATHELRTGLFLSTRVFHINVRELY